MRQGMESHQLVARVLLSLPVFSFLPAWLWFSLSTEHLRGPALPGRGCFVPGCVSVLPRAKVIEVSVVQEEAVSIV